MSLTDGQRIDLSVAAYEATRTENWDRIFSMVGEWLESVAESEYQDGLQEGELRAQRTEEEIYDEAREDIESDREYDERQKRLEARFLDRFEYRQKGIWHCVYDAERQEILPGIYTEDQAKTVAADLNRRFRDG